jgi:phosphoribosyl 1,2-cyclic phosphate phosphodiesterase
VLNALRKESHISHFTLSEAVDLVSALDVPQGYATHISHQLGRHEEVEKDLPACFRLAYDGLSISI